LKIRRVGRLIFQQFGSVFRQLLAVACYGACGIAGFRKAELRRKYRYEARLVQEGIDRIAQRQEAERLKQKKLEKSYEDFMKLLTFVETVEDDDFWRSEVVQITAKTTPSGALEVELTPRSGRFAVLFGRLEDVERKFDKLLRFYRSGLSSIGWSEYRTIDIRYNDQVVCKK